MYLHRFLFAIVIKCQIIFTLRLWLHCRVCGDVGQTNLQLSWLTAFCSDSTIESIILKMSSFLTHFWDIHSLEELPQPITTGTLTHAAHVINDIVKLNKRDIQKSKCFHREIWSPYINTSLSHVNFKLLILSQRCSLLHHGCQFGPKVGQIAPKSDKSGTFSDLMKILSKQNPGYVQFRDKMTLLGPKSDISDPLSPQQGW